MKETKCSNVPPHPPHHAGQSMPLFDVNLYPKQLMTSFNFIILVDFESGDPKYSFLEASDPLHAYYQRSIADALRAQYQASY